MDNLSPTLSWMFISTLCFIFIVSLTLNLILVRFIKVVLGGRLRHPKLRHFLISLASVNVLVTIIALPVWVYVLVDNIVGDSSKLTENLSAILYYTFDLFYGLLVLLHIVVLMTERLHAIGWPLQHRIAADLPDYFTCIAIWFLAVLSSSVAIIVYHFNNFKELALVVSAVCFPILLVISMVLFTAIIITKNKSFSTEIRNRDFKLSMVVSLVALCFITLSAPLHVINAVHYTCPGCNISYFVTLMSLRCLQYSSTIFIVAIFLFGVDEFRSRVAWCYFKCCSINEHSENDLLHMDIPGVAFSNLSSSQCTLTRATKSNTNREEVELDFTNNKGTP